jgi:hypothetical protein
MGIGPETSMAAHSEGCVSTQCGAKCSGNVHVDAENWREERYDERTRGWMQVVMLHAMLHGEVIGFDQAAESHLPAGWSVAMTHSGAPPMGDRARCFRSPSAAGARPTLARSDRGRFPLAICDHALLRNREISVAFKAVEGNAERAAGIVWRYRDPNNYYIVRANALENNVVLYKVEAGTRLSLAPKGLPSRAYGVKHEIPSARWNTLGVVLKDSLFTVFLNGKQIFQAEDRTFPEAGTAGLWTKADSLTYFADFTWIKQ